MRRTGQSVCGHPHAAAVFSNRSRNASGSSCGPIFCTGMWVGGAGTVGFSPARTSRSIQLRNSSRSSRWFWTRAQNLLSWSALMSISALWCSWWSPASDWMTSANGDPDGEDMMAAAFRLPSPGFGNQCSKVRRKEGSGQGWLVKTQVFLFKADKLTQVRTLRHPETSTLSFVSAITLCIRSDCFLSDSSCARVFTLSLSASSHSTVALLGLSTPITAIRHRCSSFCTWPTYLPLSPESFSRCRLRWTTPPSPQSGLIISTTADLLGFSWPTISRVYREWSEKLKISSEQQLCGWKCLVDVRGEWADWLEMRERQQ